MSSSILRVKTKSMLSGCPCGVIVTNGTLNGALSRDERSILMRSARSLIRCIATGSPREVEPVLPGELLEHVLDHHVVEVEPAQEDVAARGLHLEHAVADLDDRDVKSSAPRS